MATISANTVLVLIDVQKGFEDPCWGPRNNRDAEQKIVQLLSLWRAMKMPIVHVRHMSVEPNSPLRPGQKGNEFLDEVTPLPSEHIEEKSVNSAFIGTALESFLRENSYDTLVMVGFTSDHCVSTSTRMAANLGFRTFLVADATATFDRYGYDGRHFCADEVHACSLASLNQEFATIVQSSELISVLN